MLTINEIRENYKKFDDWKIKELALNPRVLRKEIVPVLNEEILRRNLDVELIKWVNYETNTFEGLQRKNLIQKIRTSKCSCCFEKSKLNGYEFNTITSALIFTKERKERQIICKDCAKSKRIKSMSTTFFLGWWSKKGFLSTPFTLITDLIRIFRKEAEDAAVIDDFISNNTGKLRIALEDGHDLNRIIGKFNHIKSGNEF